MVKSKPHDMAVDWWSVGVLCYELLTGSSPFTGDTDNKCPNMQSDISERILTIEPDYKNCHLSDTAVRFISKLLRKDPLRRLGKKFAGMCLVLMIKLFNRFHLGGNRESAEEIKRDKFFYGIDWLRLARKEISAPFKPTIDSRYDVSNFSTEFTATKPADEPAAPPPNHERLFRGNSSKIFREWGGY